ncbi:MAG TPA: hypothetical protein VIN72_04475 [Lutibacter sp.]
MKNTILKNYRFGSPLILPVVAINKNFNEKWGVEAMLPILIKSRYIHNSGLNWLNTLEIDGASYKITIWSQSLDNLTISICIVLQYNLAAGLKNDW